MKRYLFITILLLIVGFLLYTIVKKRNNEKIIEEQASVLLERINNISKLMVVEGHFHEIYNYRQAENIFFKLMPVEKKMIVVIKAKAYVGYDLEKMDIKVDKVNKKVIIGKLPKPDIIIEPDVTYYDINQSSFYKFTEGDFNQINKRARSIIENQVKSSSLIPKSKERVIEVLEGLIFTAEMIGWQVEMEEETAQKIKL